MASGPLSRGCSQQEWSRQSFMVRSGHRAKPLQLRVSLTEGEEARCSGLYKFHSCTLCREVALVCVRWGDSDWALKIFEMLSPTAKDMLLIADRGTYHFWSLMDLAVCILCRENARWFARIHSWLARI